MPLLVAPQKVTLFAGSLFTNGLKSRNAVAHAKRSLVREQLGTNRGAVQGSCHNLEAPQATFCRPLCKASVDAQQIEQVATSKVIANALVKLGTLRGKAIGAIIEQLVREVTRRHKNDPLLKNVRYLLHQLTNLVVESRGETREPHANHLWMQARSLTRRHNEVQRNHSCVVELRLALAACAGG